MSDLVERLLAPPTAGTLVDKCREMADLNEEAADEIERLRADLTHASVYAHDAAAENAQLRATLAIMRENCWQACERLGRSQSSEIQPDIGEGIAKEGEG